MGKRISPRKERCSKIGAQLIIHFSIRMYGFISHTVISLPIRGETLAIGAVFGARGNVRKGVADARIPLTSR